MRPGPLVWLWLLLGCAQASAESFVVVDAAEDEIEVEVLPAKGELLTIFLVDLDQAWSGFETIGQAMTAAGVEVWRVDLLKAYFLPRSNETLRTLPGTGVEALLDAAAERSGKRVLLLGYDRWAVPLVRGAQAWQARHPQARRLAGAVLLFPNFYGPPPAAGEEPELDPLVGSIRLPLLVVQPERGVHRWRLGSLMRVLWEAGVPAHSLVLSGVRDWFFLDKDAGGTPETGAITEVAQMLPHVAALLASYPSAAGAVVPPPREGARVRGLVPVTPARPAPALSLRDTKSREHALGDYAGKVTLVSFWATWCPPCVEEIPSMNRLAGHYSPDDFEIVSVNFRESADVVDTFMQRVAVEFPVLLDPDGRASTDWKVFSFPSSFLLDRQGRIRWAVNSAIAWDQPEVLPHIDQLVRESEGTP